MTGFNYNRLFNARIAHTFYVSGISKNDLAVVPTSGTLKAMKNSGMLFRMDNEGFRVLYKVTGNTDEDGSPFINFTNVPLVFALQLINTNEFLNFTDLTGYTPGKILYFTNRSDTTTSALTLQFLDFLRPSVFTYQFPQIAGGPSDIGSIVITNQTGADVTPAYPVPTNVVPVGTSYFYPIDFSSLPKGLYNFQTTTASGTQTKTVYIDTDLASGGAFGIVDLLIPGAGQSNFPVAPNKRTYSLNFVRRQTQWKYFVVLQSGNATSSDTITIVDDGGSQSPYGALTFTPDAIPNTTINNIPTKVINSVQVNIPFFEIPKRKLSIMKNSDPDPTVTNIPGPTINLVSAPAGSPGITEIFVYI